MLVIVPTVTLTKKSQSSTWNAMSLTASPCFIRCRPISEGRENPKTVQTEVTVSHIYSEGRTYLHFQGSAEMQRQRESVRRGATWDQRQLNNSAARLQTGSARLNLILSDDVGHHLTTARLQTLVGQRLKAHLITVEGGCL